MLKLYSKEQIKVLVGSLLMMMAFGMVNASVGYFVAPVTQSLGVSRASFTFYYTIMNLVGIVVMPFIGQMMTRVSPRRIVLLGGLGGGLCIAGFSLCSQLWMFYLLGVLLGLVHSGCTMLAVVAVINSWFGDKSGTPTGIAMAGTGVSGILLGLTLPTVLEHLGWRTGYLCMGVCWTAAMLLAAALVGSKPSGEGASGPSDQAPGSGGAERSGITFSQAVRSPRLYALMLGIFVLSAPGCFLQHMPAYFVEQGTSDLLAGTIMSTFSMFVIVFKILQGYLFDRFGAAKTTVLAVLVYAAGFWVALSKLVPVLYLSAILLAFGMASLTVLPPLLTRTVFGSRDYAAIYSITSIAYTLGNATGVPLWGMVHDGTGAYSAGVLCAPILLLADLALLLALLTHRSKAHTALRNET